MLKQFIHYFYTRIFLDLFALSVSKKCDYVSFSWFRYIFHIYHQGIFADIRKNTL